MFKLKEGGAREEWSRDERTSKKRGGTLAEGSMWKANSEGIFQMRL